MVICCGSCCLAAAGKSAVDLELVPVTTRNSAAGCCVELQTKVPDDYAKLVLHSRRRPILGGKCPLSHLRHY